MPQGPLTTTFSPGFWIDEKGEKRLYRGSRTKTKQAVIGGERTSITTEEPITKRAAETIIKKERGGKRMYMLIDADEKREAFEVLTPTQLRVLDTILAETEPSNGECRLDVTSIAEKTGIHRSKVSPAISVLLKREYLARPRRGAFVVNPWYGYKGSAEDWPAMTIRVRRPIRDDVHPDTGEVFA